MKSTYEFLIDKWLFRLDMSQKGHYIQCERYLRLEKITGVLLILSSGMSIIPLTKLGFLSIEEVEKLQYISSIVTVITANIQVFMSWGEKSEIHRNYASKYGSLKRELELLRLNCNKSFFYKLNRIKDIWNTIADTSPLTHKNARNKAKMQFTK